MCLLKQPIGYTPAKKVESDNKDWEKNLESVQQTLTYPMKLARVHTCF